MQANPALVLNADYRPISTFPLSLLTWQDAVTAVVKKHVHVLAEYDKVVRSPTSEMRLPSVVAMRDYVPIKKRVAFTRQNVFLRDRFRCQYCGSGEARLTFDHVVPRSRGGATSWTNIVAACDACNVRKSNKADMQPMKVPREPTAGELLALKRAYLPKVLHESWLDYLDLDAA